MLAYGDSSGDENSMDEEESDDGAGVIQLICYHHRKEISHYFEKQVKPINLTDLGIYDEKAAPEYQGEEEIFKKLFSYLSTAYAIRFHSGENIGRVSVNLFHF